MKFRRTKREQASQTPEATAAPTSAEDASPSPGAAAPVEGGSAAGPADPRAQGPWDSTEVTLDESDGTLVDLGGLVVRGRPGIELRLQVDEASSTVVAVLLVGAEGAVEVRPFAAPRRGDIWSGVRKQIAAETARRGGTATEAEGPFGTELRVVMPVTTPDGTSATQPSRVLGIVGPRWLLRATLLGRPAVEPGEEGEILEALRDLVVVRGPGAMAPGEPLPLTMPAGGARPDAASS